jgi:glycine cleavage system H protein
MNPEELKYTQEHEWVKIDGTNAVIGISGHAQGELGDITYVELPSLNRTVAKKDSLGVIESVKAASDFYAPIGGTVSKVNSALEETPEKINSSPYDEGWLCELKDITAADADNLISATEYQDYLNNLNNE